MSDPNLGIVENNAVRRHIQYEAIRKWITDNQTLLLHQGTRLEDNVGTQVAMVTNVVRQSDGLQRNTWNNGQNNRGNTSRRQNGWNNRQQQQGNTPQNQVYNPGSRLLVTSCALCSLIKESDVSQEYVNRDFKEVHWKVTDRSPHPNPNQCLSWMMLSAQYG